MRIGIVADIHDAADHLANALERFRERGVARVVTLGDAFESFLPGEDGPRVASLLQGAGACGVWGNHDIALSRDVDDELRRTADATLLAFAGTLEPRLLVGECGFAHIEPWRDPTSLVDLWAFDSVEDLADVARRSFAARAERLLFMGHLHRWFCAGANGVLAWDGVERIGLPAPGRWLVGVAAVLDGWCAVYDTQHTELEPVWCGPADELGARPVQVAVLVYRRDDEGALRVCLIRRAGEDGWGVPKGFVDPGATHLGAACAEALEEAGVRGIIERDAVGVYHDDKWGQRYGVALFAMELRQEEPVWPEAGFRERAWLSASVALERLGSHAARALIERTIQRLERSAR